MSDTDERYETKTKEKNDMPPPHKITIDSNVEIQQFIGR